MKVLILPSWYFKADTDSIAGMVFLQHAQELRKRGIDAQIAFVNYSPSSSPYHSGTFKKERGVPTFRASGWFPPKFSSPVIKLWIRNGGNRIIKFLKTITLPDIIHAQGYHAAWIAEYINRHTAIPYLVTEHNSAFLQKKIPSYKHAFIKTAFDQAYWITAVSPGLKGALSEFTQKEISVIPNFYDPSVFYPDSWAQKSSHFQWLCVGEPMFTKGLDLLIHAFSMVAKNKKDKSMRLVLADKIPEQHHLETLAHRLRIHSQIDFVGLLSPGQVADLMRKSHALVSASRFETFGKTIVEANACGIPVVATKTAGANYIMASDAQGIRCNPNSVDDLTRAMLDMVENISFYHPEAIHQSVAWRFNIDQVVDQWMDIYKTILRD